MISNLTVCDACVFHAALFDEMKLFAVLCFLVWLGNAMFVNFFCGVAEFRALHVPLYQPYYGVWRTFSARSCKKYITKGKNLYALQKLYQIRAKVNVWRLLYSLQILKGFGEAENTKPVNHLIRVLTTTMSLRAKKKKKTYLWVLREQMLRHDLTHIATETLTSPGSY